MTQALVQESTEVLAYHGRTFRLASFLLPKKAREDAAVTYAFCRLVDDTVDEASSVENGRAGLTVLREDLAREEPGNPLLRLYRALCAKHGIPLTPATDLMDGAEQDTYPVRFQTDEELIQYGYRVAGTVGLMMARVIGVRDEAALHFAIDLGIGMQITNICRDVGEDAEKGRVYVPCARLEEAGVRVEDLLAGKADGRGIAPVICALAELAEEYYSSGFLGLKAIPLRARMGILAALYMYREIGRLLVRRGGNPMLGRTYVGPWRKAWFVVKAVVVAPLASLLGRGPHQRKLHAPLKGLDGVNYCGGQ